MQHLVQVAAALIRIERAVFIIININKPGVFPYHVNHPVVGCGKEPRLHGAILDFSDAVPQLLVRILHDIVSPVDVLYAAEDEPVDMVSELPDGVVELFYGHSGKYADTIKTV